MTHINQFKKTIILIGDIALFYISLYITLTIRYGTLPNQELWDLHKMPFLYVHILWVLILYIAGLYEIEKFISVSALRNRVIKTMITAGVLAVFLFYIMPSTNVTPKTNLIIDVILISFALWAWRKLIFKRAVRTSKIKTFFTGNDDETISFKKFIEKRPQLGYKTIEDISQAELIIVSEQSKKNDETLGSLYKMIKTGKTIIDFDKFYESITGKIPVSMIGKAWFLENFVEINKQAFEKFKYYFDVLFALILFVPYLIILPFIALSIKTNSKGPVFYKQSRVGKNGRIFEIIKFRSMIFNAEKDGVQWAKERDNRVTAIGKILRKTRIDELPQLWNVIKGEISIIGPRPERPEFVKELAKEIPHYSMRHLVKPGLSGWAQINFPYGASTEDSTQKLQYDLYYIKNRSLVLDVTIFLKTIMVVLSREGR